MDSLSLFIAGLEVATQPINLFVVLVGVTVGTLIGVLPGIGPVGAMAILLPITMHIPPASVLILLSGIYYGAQYGGSTTAILVRIPGEASSIITCLDGYELSRKGKAGTALAIAALSSFVAGTLSVIGLMLFAVPLARNALKLGPPEMFALMVLGLSIIVVLVRGSILKGVIMALVGFLLGTVGQDSISGVARFYMGSVTLLDGLGIVAVAMGIYGLGEVLGGYLVPEKRAGFSGKITRLMPSGSELREASGPTLRGSALGFLLGLLPGGGPMISTFASYSLEKKISKEPETFGTGKIAGLAGPEAANNAAAGGAFVPLFAMGLAPNAVMAMLLGALMIHGLQPGPLLIRDHPDIFWGTIASMYVGNLFLLVLNLPLIGLWVRVLRIPTLILFPLILLACVIGAYAVNYTTGDLVVMMVFGIFGIWIMRVGYEAAPLILAFIIGPMLEQNFQQSLLISRGDFSIFVTRPIAGLGILAAVLIVGAVVLTPRLRRVRDQIAENGDDA